MPNELRKEVLARHKTLTDKRSAILERYKEISRNFQPLRGKFLTNERNRAESNNHIINSTPRRAALICAAGMLTGASSPAREWARISSGNPDVASQDHVRTWLHGLLKLCFAVLGRSNFYVEIAKLYLELATFATVCLWMDEDDRTHVRYYTLPIGECSFDINETGEVDTCYRGPFRMTVRQMVRKFGLASCSPEVQKLWEDGKKDEEREVIHACEPNRDRIPGRVDAAGMPFRSVWVEVKASDEQPPLRVSGYQEQPFAVARWMSETGEIYGTGPGWDALPDAKMLQELEREKLNAMKKVSSPPLSAPASMRGKPMSILPGKVIYREGPSDSVQPLFLVDARGINEIRQEIGEVSRRIMDDFYATIMLLISGDQGPQKTAEEIRARQEEKMMQLGSVTNHLHTDLFDLVFDRLIGILWRRGMIPPPPDGLTREALRVEYTSILSQAQKLMATGGLERLSAMVNNLAAGVPDAVKKVDWDVFLEAYNDSLGNAPNVLKDDERVAAEREAEQQQVAQMQATEDLAQTSQAVRNLGQTDMGGDSALSRVASSLGPIAAAATGLEGGGV